MKNFNSGAYLAIVAVCCGAMMSLSARAETIAIIGTGEVAQALGPEFAAQGHTIIYGSRDPARNDVAELISRTGSDASATLPPAAAGAASIVVLAVPGELVESITISLGNLSGKIIIDPTNALRRNADGYFEMDVSTSNAEVIQEAAPGAFVVKAFNTLNWRTMVDPALAGGPVTIPLVGDSSEAKGKVAELVEGMGLEAIDLGPVRHARYVEGMLILWINNRFTSRGEAFDYYLRKTP
jgi:predicted dinucleotide-binding enzyme